MLKKSGEWRKAFEYNQLCSGHTTDSVLKYYAWWTRDHMRSQGSKLRWLDAMQATYLLYYLSGPCRKFNLFMQYSYLKSIDRRRNGF